MKKKISSIFAIVIASVLIAIEFMSPIAAAKKIEIEAGQEDIYNELEEAAKVNAAMNILRKCLRSDKYTPNDGWTQSGSDVAKGDIFQFPGLAYRVEMSTTLWMEDIVQGNGGDDGAIWCHQTDGKPLLKAVTDILGVNVADIVCYPDGRGRIYKRDGNDSDCQHFNDSGAKYVRSSNWEDGLKDFYENWRKSSQNKYLPTYNEIGNFNNVDGYFNYLLDFNKYCGYTGTPSATKGENETAYPVTSFERSNEKIVVKTRYYHLSEDKSWENPLSTDNPVTSCSGLLQRVETLKDTWNEAIREDDRQYGYSGIILADLEDACTNLKTADGENAYEALRKELEAVRDDTTGSATDEDKQKAKENLATLAGITDYVVSEGSESDENGKIYKCVDIEGLKITLDEYHPPSETIGEEPSGGEQEASCFDGTGVVGWIVCPIIEFLGDFIQGVYEAFIVPFLQLDVELFKSDSPIYEVWSNLRDVANLGFIIFFIVVIFSQLTGVGIDNYGIKKILPKLIMGAVLINLSFIICQLAVDLSNILGYAIENILDSWMPTAGQLNITRTHGAGTVIGSIALDGILLIGIVKFLVLPAVLAIGPEIWVAVLLAVITIAIAILFCFILLTVRKSFAVLLVIISPLAFMCYILPNTKGLFDKWFKTFKSVLLAFPICSAMIYGGQFVGRVLVQAAANNGGHAHFSVALSGAVISIVPIFLIPTVLRHSMGAIGSMMGRLQGGLTRAARFHAGNSGWAQEKKLQSMQYRNARRAGFQANFKDGSVRTDAEGNLIARGGIYDTTNAKGNGRFGWRRLGRKLAGVNDHSIAMARGRMLNDMNMRDKDQKLANGDSFRDAMTAQQVESYMNGGALEGESRDFATLTNNMDADTMANELASLVTSGNTSRQAIIKRTALAKAMATGSGDMKKKLSGIMSGSYKTNDNQTHSVNVDSDVFRELAKDSTIRGGVGEKNQYVARAMEAANSGQASSYTDWASVAGNKEDVTSHVLDKNNLFSQSGGVIQDAITQTDANGRFIVSSERIENALNNDNLDLDDDTRNAMVQQLESRGYETKEKKAERMAADTEKAKKAEADAVTQRHQEMMGAFTRLSQQMGQMTVQHNNQPQPKTGPATKVPGEKWHEYQGPDGKKVRAIKFTDGTIRDQNNSKLDPGRWTPTSPKNG